ncbi:unnamed protein product [Spirodela intermedia]|uniref:Uncharacterized protein n=1 Tax=Spirodela intermedia TaxID=51605 RepID=A0A7I8JAR5_SPIIN|nr:unnamed protein product [Spirodela intermedia]CAA6667210.1 unnamed protein product [Spirodela intermedia]
MLTHQWVSKIQGAKLMDCDNEAAMFILNHKTFHLRTMHIKTVCHVIR